jgi:thiamine biosynthesis protein ThiI
MPVAAFSFLMALFMIRYGEIALKSRRVRSRFERALGENIAARFVRSGVECRIEYDRGRIFLWSDDIAMAEVALSRTFGIVSFSQVIETTSSRDDIFRTAAEVSKPLFRQGMRFCIRARRAGQHDYTSMELARDAGSAVFLANEQMGPKVDLTRPELEIFIEVRHNHAYVYTGSTPGTGGMPLGTQGRVLGLVSEERDIAACWLMMKRGCRVIVATDNPDQAGPLGAWDQDLKVHALAGGESLGDVARKRRADGLCVGWGIDGFDRYSGEIAGLEMPVFYPLIGMTNEEIDGLLDMITA